MEETHFTEQEEKFFWDVIDSISEYTGINYFDLFNCNNEFKEEADGTDL